jgi:hypothetical protein
MIPNPLARLFRGRSGAGVRAAECSEQGVDSRRRTRQKPNGSLRALRQSFKVIKPIRGIDPHKTKQIGQKEQNK